MLINSFLRGVVFLANTDIPAIHVMAWPVIAAAAIGTHIARRVAYVRLDFSVRIIKEGD